MRAQVGNQVVSARGHVEADGAEEQGEEAVQEILRCTCCVRWPFPRSVAQVSGASILTLLSGDAKALRTLCLPPLAATARSQIAARGPVKTSWQLLKFKSARIVSHRCSPLGGDHPDTSYRQCIVRLESEQQLSVTPVSSPAATPKAHAPRWAPSYAQSKKAGIVAAAAAPAEQGVEAKEKGKVETVVEYVVMQTRVMDGKEEDDWKLWGFTGESTPAKIEEDEAYWRKMLDIQAASASA